MRLLLIHQNFPAQFIHVARLLAERGHELVGIGRRRGAMPAGITYGLYTVEEPQEPFTGVDPLLEFSLRRGLQVREACQGLRQDGWIPDAVLFHSSWGEGFYLRDIWPEQRLVAYPELWGSPQVMGYGIDPTLGAPSREFLITIRHQNLLALQAISESDAMVSPTQFQRDSFPERLRDRFQIIHEGVDVEICSPYERRCLCLSRDLALRSGDPVVTYCSRHLEPLRGLPTFLRAVALLQRRHPTVHVIVAGKNSKGYGPPSSHPGGHLGVMLEELSGQLDFDRLHLLGEVSHNELRGIFQISSAHVYLTHPYTLSWSLLEAMACGAPVIGSRGLPVEEVIRDEDNGLLVDFNSPNQLCEAMMRCLDDDQLRSRISNAGRATVVDQYNMLDSVNRYEQLLTGTR